LFFFFFAANDKIDSVLPGGVPMQMPLPVSPSFEDLGANINLNVVLSSSTLQTTVAGPIAEPPLSRSSPFVEANTPVYAYRLARYRNDSLVLLWQEWSIGLLGGNIRKPSVEQLNHSYGAKWRRTEGSYYHRRKAIIAYLKKCCETLSS
jgi:hypothetical protein